MKALIDGDVVTYRCGFAAQHVWYDVCVKEVGEVLASFRYKKEATAWVNGQDDLDIVKRVEVEPLHNALQNVRTLLRSTLHNTKSNEYQIYLSGSTNFRFDVAKTAPYKGNRDPEAKPHWYKEIREYLQKQWSAEVVEGIEADDAMGIAQETTWHPTCICSIDKDLDMIPGPHYNFNSKEVYFVSTHEANTNFYRQLLTGDTVDNIIGVPRIGPKTASILLKPCKTYRHMWNVCCQAYNDIDHLEENAQLLWIKRNVEDDLYPHEQER